MSPKRLGVGLLLFCHMWSSILCFLVIISSLLTSCTSKNFLRRKTSDWKWNWKVADHFNPVFFTLSFNPRTFQPGFFNYELFNHELFNYAWTFQLSEAKSLHFEKSRVWHVLIFVDYITFQPHIFHPNLQFWNFQRQTFQSWIIHQPWNFQVWSFRSFRLKSPGMKSWSL